MDSYAIEIKKVILGSLYNTHATNLNLIQDIITQLDFFSNNSTINYTLEAAEYIVAYLHLGFSYLEHKKLFDTTLRKAGFSEASINMLQKRNTPIPLNKDRLRTLFGRWPASPHNSHTINEALKEIILNVENNNIGFYQYYTAKKDGCYTALYTLTVTADYALFSDVFNNKFYSLVKKEIVTEKTPFP